MSFWGGSAVPERHEVEHRGYSKHMHDVDWHRVYERQEARARLVNHWLDRLALAEGDRFLDVGSGPGFVALEAARRVGPTGRVVAVDRAAGALEYLRHRQEEQGFTNIERLLAPAESFTVSEGVDKALVADMLHHSDDPARVLRQVARAVEPGGPILVVEFAADGPAEHGPPLAERIDRETLARYIEGAGLSIEEFIDMGDEHYGYLVRREAG